VGNSNRHKEEATGAEVYIRVERYMYGWRERKDHCFSDTVWKQSGR
jgi:hypothetical protein